jgi:MFS transporter, FLVCR family, feline leukemia virus subgroup C receptor-related protein
VFSLKPDQFAFALFGQSIVAISQIFVLAVPIRLAKIWFSPEQVKVDNFFEVA